MSKSATATSLDAPIIEKPKVHDTRLVVHKGDVPNPRQVLRSADFTHHGGFDTTWNVPEATSDSVVMVSITEIGLIGGVLKPFQGAASMSVDNIVPDQGVVRVRGSIGWGSDLNARLSFLIG
jgi:hypothetical protein